MPMIRRVNTQGSTYIISANPNDLNTTTVSNNGNRIEVRMNFHEFDQAWFNWVMKGQLIQNAFPNLTADQREFMMTGITPKEWKLIFGEGN